MKKVLKDNAFLFKTALIAAIIIILDHFYPSIFKYIIMGILICILLYIIGMLIHKLIIKKIIRNSKIKKVSKKDIKVLNDFIEFEFDEKLLIDNGLNNYIKFIKCLISDFKEMEHNIHYNQTDMEEDLNNISKIRNKTLKEYINKAKDVLKIIFKYYDEKGIRNI